MNLGKIYSGCFSTLLWKSEFSKAFSTDFNLMIGKKKTVRAKKKRPGGLLYKLKFEHNFTKNKLLNELLTEAGFLASPVLFNFSKKLYLSTIPITNLKHLGLLNNETDVLQNFICQIKDFPFSPAEVLLNVPAYQPVLTIAQNKLVVEQKYLAWKLNVMEKSIQKIYTYFGIYLFKGSSLKSVQENLELLNKIENIDKWNLANKILFLNLIPCDMEMVKMFNKFLSMIKWNTLAYNVPKLVNWPHKIILILIDILEKNNFSDEQIQEAINCRDISIYKYVQKLDIILNSEQLSKFHNEKKFFHLLKIPKETLKKSKKLDTLYLEHLKESMNKSEITDGKDEYKKLKAEVAIRNIVTSAFNLSEADVKILHSHPNWLKSTTSEVYETFDYLTANFSKIEIIESLPILLYTRKAIEKAMEGTMLKRDELIKAGFQNGLITSTSIFTRGSKTENKQLSLCLYFLEKDNQFF